MDTRQNEDLITIGITAYNAAATIERALRSTLGQSWPNSEIIVIDDASNDETPDILTKLSKEYEQLQIIRHEKNRGVAASRNRIIKEAAGEFIAFFDDDDESAPERLEKQYRRITAYEQQYADGAPVICHTARIQHYPDSRSHYEPTIGTDERTPAPSGEDVAKRILFGKPMTNGFGSLATCSQMARTKTYRDLNGFDENFRRCEDTEFNIRLALAGGHFTGIAEALVIQAMTYGSDKSIKDERCYYVACIQKHRTFIEKYMPYFFCENWLAAKYDYLAGNTGHCAKKMITLALRHPVHTLRRLYWAAPNLSFNRRFKRFHERAA